MSRADTGWRSCTSCAAVGRSHHQAYAYLMVPDLEGLTKQATMRLDAIQAMEELGSGLSGHARPGDSRCREVLGETRAATC